MTILPSPPHIAENHQSQHSDDKGHTDPAHPALLGHQALLNRVYDIITQRELQTNQKELRIPGHVVTDLTWRRVTGNP